MRRVAARSAGGRIAGRLAVAVADQGVSSATNLGLGLSVAHVLPAPEFGAFALAFAGYLVALGLSRSLCSEPLLVRAAGMSRSEQDEATGQSTGSALVVGIAGTCVLSAAGLAAGGAFRESLLAFALCLPGVLLQDAWRFAFLAQRAPQKALVNDLVWACLLAPAVMWLVWTGNSSSAGFIAVWGLAGSIAAVIGMRQARVRPRPGGSMRWWRRQRDLAGRYAGEFAATAGCEQLTLWVIAGLLGLAAAGSIRVAQLLLGPINVLVMGFGMGSVAEAAHLSDGDLVRLRRMCARAGCGLAAAAGVWMLALLAVPDGVGTRIVPGWPAARDLFVPLGLTVAAWGATTGAAIGLRGRGDARRGLRARLAQTTMSLGAAVAGSVVAGPRGAAWGLAVAGWAGAAVWWRMLAENVRRTGRDVPPSRSPRILPREVAHGAISNS